MRKLFQEIKDTIRLEFGKINIYDAPLVHSVDVNFVKEIPSINQIPTKIHESAPKVAIKSEEIPQEGNLRIKDTTIRTVNVNTGNIDFSRLNTMIKDPIIQIQSPPIKDEAIIPISLVLRNFANLILPESSIIVDQNIKFSVNIKRDTKNRNIWIISIPKSRIEKRKEIIDALERALKKFKGKAEDVKSVGYYKHVPLGLSKEILLPKNRLVVIIDPRRLKKRIFADLIILKTKSGIITEVVKRCSK